MTERCESTWSGPFCASSSTTKTTVFFQNRERESASTSRPSARSLSANAARGEIAPTRMPEVWSFGSVIVISAGKFPSRSNWWNSSRKISIRC